MRFPCQRERRKASLTTLWQLNKGKNLQISSDVKARGHFTSVTQPNKLTSSRRSVSWAQSELTTSEINKKDESDVPWPVAVWERSRPGKKIASEEAKIIFKIVSSNLLLQTVGNGTTLNKY